MYRSLKSGLVHAAILFSALLLNLNLFAQAPEGINYQAVARTADGSPLADTTLNVNVNIAQDVDLNVIDYSEVHSVTTNAFGLFSLIIGSGTPTSSGVFSTIDWSAGDKFLNIEVGSLDMGTTQLMSVPFALYAASSGNTITLDSSRLDSSNNTLIIYADGDSILTDLSALSGDSSIDTLFLENDSALQVIEAGDTFLVDLSAFRNELNLDNDSTNERVSELILDANNDLIVFEGGFPSDTVDLGPLRDEFDFAGVVGDSIKFVFNGDTVNSLPLNQIVSGIDTNIADGLIVGTELALINNAGDTVFVDISSLATDAEVADIETSIYQEIDADSTFLNDSIDQVAANLIAEVNFLISELADDSTYLNDSIDQVASDLTAFIATNIDTNITEGLIVGTELALINSVGDTVFVDISSLATDAEVADIETSIYNEIDADSTFLNDSIDQVAANLIAEVNFLISELADDSTYLNDSIDQVAADLTAFIATNIDTNITEGLIVGTELALINSVGDTVFVDISSLATDVEVADIETSIYNEIDADSTFLNDSIDQVALALDGHILSDSDIDSTNELISQLFESGDSLFVIESGDTFAIDLSGLSPDTLDRIVLDDSNLLVMQTGQFFVNFDNNDELTVSSKGLKFQNLNDFFIGNTLTGQSDDVTYVENIGIGAQALQEAVNVPRNTAIGARSFQSLTTGGSNTGVGRWSGVDFNTGSDNVMLGNFAGGAISNGDRNVFVGSDINGTNFGTINDISGGIRIGYQAGNLDSADNRMFIDNSNTNSPLIWGDFANNIMQIGGTFRVNNLVGDTLSYPTSDGDSGWVMQTDGAGQLSFTDFSIFGDNLGNHTLDSNLRLGDFYISKDGDDEGIRIDTGGNVGIGLAPDPSDRLRVDGTAFFDVGPSEYVTVRSYSGGLRVIDGTPGSHSLLESDNGGPYYRALLETETVFNTAQFSSNGYGDTAHIWSTGDLVFNNGGYENATMILDQSGNLGIGTAETNALPISKLDVKTSGFLNTTLRGDNSSGTWLNIGNDEGRYYQLISTGTTNAEGEGKLLISYGDTNNSAAGTVMVFDSNRIGLGTSAPQYRLDVAARAEIDTLQINNAYTLPSSDGSNGFLMQTDGLGQVSFVDPNTVFSTTQSGIDTVLSYGSNANNDSILNLGYLTIGTTTPAARLDVVDNTENFSINVTNSTSSAADKKGVFSTVTGAGGGDNYGMYGEANAATGNKFGVYGGALGAGGIKYGIYGNAQGAGTNYAGYFENGDVYIDGNLGIGDVGPVRRLDITGDIGVDSVFTNELSINNFLFPDPGLANIGQVLSFNGTDMVWDTVATDDGDFVRNGNYLNPANTTDSLILGNNIAPIAVLDVWGQAYIDTTLGAYSDIDVMISSSLSSDSVSTDTLEIGGLTGAFPYKLTADSPANNGDVLTYQNGNTVWQGIGGGVFENSGGVVRDTGGYAINDFVFGSPQLDDNGNAGNDSRILFDKSTGSFRAGTATGTSWDAANRGQNSVAIGLDNEASGDRSTVGGGGNNTASGFFTTIGGGISNTAINSNATIAGGQLNTASNDRVAIGGGLQNTASGLQSTISGGLQNSASGRSSTVAGGELNEVAGNWGAVLGGHRNRSQSYGEVVMGLNNDTLTAGFSPLTFVPTERLFVIGNGTNDANRSNALVMLKSGNTTLNGEFTISDGTDSLTFADYGTTATNGDVLTFQNGNAVWQGAAAGGNDTDWDTTLTGDTVFTPSKYVGIGTSNPGARFGVVSSDSINALFLSAGTNGGAGTSAPGVVITNAKTGLGNNLGALVTASGGSADNFGVASFANGGTDARGLVGDAVGGSVQSIGVQGFAASSPLSIGVRGFADAIALTDTAIAIYGDANGVGTNKYAGFFNDGDVYIKDTLEVDSVLKYSHSTVQQGFYLRTNADGTVYADTLTASTCPAGFTQVNQNYCIETTARTTETEWFEAADTCSALGASLPTWMEWYTGTKEVVGVDYNTTQSWEWIDQASQNNASIAGGGAGATLEDRRKTISADNPITPSNTIQYRCVYRLR